MILSSLCTILVVAAGAVNALTVGGAVTFAAKGTYPRATRLSDGSLLGAVSYVDGTNQVISAVISRNNGTSWATQGEVTRAPSDLSNQYIQQLPSGMDDLDPLVKHCVVLIPKLTAGRVLIAFRNHDKNSAGAITYFRITICYSDNLGVTWNYLSQPASDPAGVNGNWEPLLRLSNSGVLQLYYSRETAGNDQDSLLRTSTDGGLTWSLSQIISGANVTARDGMIGVANYGGRSLLAVFETTVNGRFQVWSVTRFAPIITHSMPSVHGTYIFFSADDGTTWGNRRLVYAPSAANSNAGAPQVVFVGSTLVASFMTDEDSANGVWPAGAAMKVVTSTNGGASWGSKTTLFTNSPNSYWPGLLTLDGVSFLALADQAGPKVKRVTL